MVYSVREDGRTPMECTHIPLASFAVFFFESLKVMFVLLLYKYAASNPTTKDKQVCLNGNVPHFHSRRFPLQIPSEIPPIPRYFFRDFSQSHQENSGMISELKPRQLNIHSFQFSIR